MPSRPSILRFDPPCRHRRGRGCCCCRCCSCSSSCCRLGQGLMELGLRSYLDSDVAAAEWNGGFSCSSQKRIRGHHHRSSTLDPNTPKRVSVGPTEARNDSTKAQNPQKTTPQRTLGESLAICPSQLNLNPKP